MRVYCGCGHVPDDDGHECPLTPLYKALDKAEEEGDSAKIAELAEEIMVVESGIEG